jgi:hypothetical protein
MVGAFLGKGKPVEAKMALEEASETAVGVAP